MHSAPTALPGVLVLEPKVFGDQRGFFCESFSQQVFDQIVGCRVEFVQDNQSRSSKGVLRGLHRQVAPNAQGKLVRVTQGSVFDVAADIDPTSATFGRWVGVELSAENHRQLWIPPGFAHGFLVLSDWADCQYKTTAYYEPAAEQTVRWDDPTLAIAWPLAGARPSLSTKDANAPLLR